MSREKQLTRRDFIRLATVTTAGAALAACAPAPAAPTAAPSGGEQPTVAAQPASGEKVNLVFWASDNQAFVKTNKELLDKFKQASPNIDVKFEYFPYGDLITKIQTAMAAKSEADVMEMFGSWVQSYAKGGTLATLPDGVLSLTAAKDLFYAAPLDGYTLNGKLYGLPNEFNLENGGVLINDGMFKAAGITDPPTWATWDALVEDAKKLTKVDNGNMTVAGFHYVNNDGLGFLFWEGILERGVDYFDKDGVHMNFLTPEAEATVQWLVDMAMKDKVVDPKTFNANSNWVGDSFFQGLVAIGYIGPWIVPLSRISHADFKDKWTYVSCPHYGDKMSFAADSGWGKTVSPNSKAQDAAWQMVKFWTMDEKNHRYWNVGTGTVPALKKVAADPTLLTDMDWLEPSLKVLPFGRYVGNLQDRDYVWYNVVATHITEAAQGQRSVKDTMALMNTEANAQIDAKLK
jgi:multiple sugar transport system substrate-binding protein